MRRKEKALQKQKIRRILECAVSVAVWTLIVSGCGEQNSANADTAASSMMEPIPREEKQQTNTAEDGKTTENEESSENPADSETDPDRQKTDEAEGAENLKSEEFITLEQELSDKIDALDGNWAVYVYAADSGEEISVHNEAMTAASLIKLFIAGAYSQAVEEGTVTDHYEEQMDVMLRRSDNDAANTLIDLLGKDTINSFAKSVGAEDTELNRRMLEKSSMENYTSVQDCGHVLEMIRTGKYVSPEASERILDDLKAQERTKKIPAGVPAGIETANKTGELADVENDAAIIWGKDRTYILTVMSENLPSADTARKNITDISSMVYDAIG